MADANGSAQVVLYDLEFTAWDGSVARNWSGPGEHREIVQIGAVILAVSDLSELGAFDRLARPRINPVLSDYFINLTGLSQDAVSGAGSFSEAYAGFGSFIGSRALYCYGRDDLVIGENLDLCAMDGSVPESHNIRDYFEACGFDLAGVSSGMIADLVRATVEADGQVHNALYDCRAIAAALRRLRAAGHPSAFDAEGRPAWGESR